LIDCQDKGSGAALFIEVVLKDAETKELLAKTVMTAFARGLGGFGYKGKIRYDFPAVPKR
jgi:hypothetical protein